MLIKDFIKELSVYNPDADITLTTSENITTSFVCKDKMGNELTKKTTMQVFIEPMDNCPECTSEYMNGDVRWCSFYDKPCSDVEECYQFEEFDG